MVTYQELKANRLRECLYRPCWILKLQWNVSTSKNLVICDRKIFASCYRQVSVRKKIEWVREVTVTWIGLVRISWYVKVVPATECWSTVGVAENGVFFALDFRNFYRSQTVWIYQAEQKWLMARYPVTMTYGIGRKIVITHFAETHKNTLESENSNRLLQGQETSI